jgi:GNAT superfamily N-acetyltransferase
MSPPPDTQLAIRRATSADLPAIVHLLADDPLGAKREADIDPLPDSYRRAFEAIDRDPHQALVVVEHEPGAVVGVLQLTFIPSITYRGGWRAQIEGVRVAASHRAEGIGRRLFEWAIARAVERGCHMVQLTTDKARPDARRFYESLGFVASHEGMKLRCPSPTALASEDLRPADLDPRDEGVEIVIGVQARR